MKNITLIWATVGTATLFSLLFAGACSRKTDYDFEQRAREAWPESIRLLSLMDGEAFAKKEKKGDYDPVRVLSTLLKSNVVYRTFQSDVYYVNTNDLFWMTNTLSSDPAIVKKIVDRSDPSRVLYVGVTFECKKFCLTNLSARGLVPIELDSLPSPNQ